MISLLAGATQAESPAVLFDNAFARGTLAASSAAADGAAANIVGPATFDYWKPAALPADLTLTLAAAETFDALALVAHDLGSKGATLVVKYSATAVSAFVTLATITPGDDTPLAMIFGAVSAQRWRLELTGAAVPAIGVAMVGQRLVIPANIAAPYTPTHFAARVELLTGASLGGQLFDSRIKRRGVQNSIRFNPVLRSWMGASLPAFARHYDSGLPFLWVASPAYDLSDVGYLRRAEGAGELRPAIASGGLWADLALEVDGYAA